tara:strand:- start:171 stop:362 length:192 start_codon:yes stop_codon:yes gene_type:complete
MISWILNLIGEPYVPGKQAPPVGTAFTVRSLNGTMGKPLVIEKKEGFTTGLFYYFKFVSRQEQ